MPTPRKFPRQLEGSQKIVRAQPADKQPVGGDAVATPAEWEAGTKVVATPAEWRPETDPLTKDERAQLERDQPGSPKVITVHETPPEPPKAAE